jgi:ribosome recycling factor
MRHGRLDPPGTTALLDTIKVDYYGSPMPLNQVASVWRPSTAAHRAALENLRPIAQAIRGVA